MEKTRGFKETYVMKRSIKSSQDAIPTYSIESVTDFLSIIESENNLSTIQDLSDKNTFVSTIYRGQLKHEKHPLLPQLLRYDKPYSTVRNQSRTKSPPINFRERESNLIEEFKRQSAFFLSTSTTP